MQWRDVAFAGESSFSPAKQQSKKNMSLMQSTTGSSEYKQAYELDAAHFVRPKKSQLTRMHDSLMFAERQNKNNHEQRTMNELSGSGLNFYFDDQAASLSPTRTTRHHPAMDKPDMLHIKHQAQTDRINYYRNTGSSSLSNDSGGGGGDYYYYYPGGASLDNKSMMSRLPGDEHRLKYLQRFEESNRGLNDIYSKTGGDLLLTFRPPPPTQPSHHQYQNANAAAGVWDKWPAHNAVYYDELVPSVKPQVSRKKPLSRDLFKSHIDSHLFPGTIRTFFITIFNISLSICFTFFQMNVNAGK
jgi:hypothetical protein